MPTRRRAPSLAGWITDDEDLHASALFYHEGASGLRKAIVSVRMRPTRIRRDAGTLWPGSRVKDLRPSGGLGRRVESRRGMQTVQSAQRWQGGRFNHGALAADTSPVSRFSLCSRNRAALEGVVEPTARARSPKQPPRAPESARYGQPRRQGAGSRRADSPGLFLLDQLGRAETSSGGSPQRDPRA
jgi:hypothetical protein